MVLWQMSLVDLVEGGGGQVPSIVIAAAAAVGLLRKREDKERVSCGL